MNFWANLTTVVFLPFFYYLDYKIKMRKPATTVKCYEMLEAEILVGMFALFLLKNIVLERSIMKRFVED